ncbi:MAG: hypothetical protein AAGE86_06885 [Pseudomonadota bacterium]
MSDPTNLQKRTNRFLRSSEIGILAISIIFFAELLVGPKAAGEFLRWSVITSYFVFFASIMVLFILRNTDEFTRDLWQVGTGSAFIVLVFATVFGVMIEGLIYIALYGAPPEKSFFNKHIGAMMLFTFYAALTIRRVQRQ